MKNYKEFKNLVHNELKITREEIKEMISQAIVAEVDKVLHDENFINTVITNKINAVMGNEYKSPNWKRLTTLDATVYDMVCDEVSRMVRKKVELRIREESNVAQE